MRERLVAPNDCDDWFVGPWRDDFRLTVPARNEKRCNADTVKGERAGGIAGRRDLLPLGGLAANERPFNRAPLLIAHGPDHERDLPEGRRRREHEDQQRRGAVERAIHGFFRLSVMMEVVSRTLLLRVLAAALLAGCIFCGRFALAGAASLDQMLSGALVPSAAPMLLGPITSAGRSGWECKPERSAASSQTSVAELPPDPTP